ncbi:isoleucine--tRNA ligase [Erysipelothrix larvae]|uniref:Isoleucine--tRNA ligase n=1 Tax=Erysipelothrix larvae TaxID=1514105 RepID=A0A0X8H213_9FIRM|nr:isoleucine--tRNA ligase [Erysipelothrix larvae]AMC94627.1 isoleucine--tRNA ligase [Erysipelothrix larvae]
MNYKDTLLLPKTDFEMRGNLNKKEPGLQQAWDEMKLYNRMLEQREGAPLFTLHDGPPFANGNIHIGHALNKSLKDFIIRSHFMAGYKTPFRPGWDTHGLPIEVAIQKTGVNRKEMSIADFRKLCEAFALGQIKIQIADFKQLGTVADYDNPYITLNKDFEAKQIKVFAKMALKGMIYKGLRPVYWSPSSESALAEAEIEYRDRKDPQIYVSFKVVDGKGLLTSDDALIIWTTTPWTIPANLAISVNETFDYALIKTDKGQFVVLEKMVEQLQKELNFEYAEVLKTFKGKELEGVTTQHPLYDRLSPVLLGDHVTDDAGTGCVHTAPDHGVEDFEVGKKYGIHPIDPIDNQGVLRENTGPFAGLYFEDANKAVTKALDECGALLKLSFITHSYAHDWRTKKPVMYRATTQWFASIDMVRDDVLRMIDEEVEWNPTWGRKRMYNMIKDRGDWTISRQRAWGVPLPILYAEDDTPIMEEKVFDHIVELFNEHGSNVWFERDAIDLLPEGYTHPGSPNGTFRKEKDIMDVWFDSGSSHTSALNHDEVPLPVDLYFEGSDQYRGWFNSSLIISAAVYGHAPYKNVVSHGFVMKDDGQKMSKSSGDALKPAKIIGDLGADILRLWVASVDYQNDAPISQNVLKQVSELYRKIRNTFRFMHGNLTDFNPDTDMVAFEDLSVLNRYVLSEVHKVNELSQEAYMNYDFQKVTTLVGNALTNLMSAYYLDYTKDILYIEGQNSRQRREIQSVLYESLMVYSRLMAPILVHTTEELNKIFRPQDESIHLTEFVKVREDVLSVQELEDFKRLFELREAVFKALEEKRADKVIGKSLEGLVKLHLSEKDQALVEQILGNNAAQWFIVSRLEFVDETLPEVFGFEVDVVKAEGSVCPRCWNIVTDAHEETGLCGRCHHVVGELHENH